jgi:hypothetical protein
MKLDPLLLEIPLLLTIRRCRHAAAPPFACGCRHSPIPLGFAPFFNLFASLKSMVIGD